MKKKYTTKYKIRSRRDLHLLYEMFTGRVST